MWQIKSVASRCKQLGTLTTGRTLIKWHILADYEQQSAPQRDIHILGVLWWVALLILGCFIIYARFKVSQLIVIYDVRRSQQLRFALTSSLRMTNQSCNYSFDLMHFWDIYGSWHLSSTNYCSYEAFHLLFYLNNLNKSSVRELKNVTQTTRHCGFHILSSGQNLSTANSCSSYPILL